MKLTARLLAFALFLAAAIGVSASTAEETLTGQIVCALCTLNKPDAKECQDVLLVESNGATTEYYIVKNEVATKAGEACTSTIPATVTGTVSEKDGRKWIAAIKIEKK